MLLWKDTFQKEEDDRDPLSDHHSDTPWKSWPRPPGGFVDVGCGNGLLVRILISEGYTGYGFDLCSRKSWTHYPENVQANLRVGEFDPSKLGSDSVPPEISIPPGAFIIANHADELTPWAPVMATISSASGYLSIPCCAWMFDCRFNREQAKYSHGDLPVDQTPNLKLGVEGLKSSYALYRRWLAVISWEAGWKIDCDTLRIPSTRNWAIVGRRRRTDINKKEAISFCKRVLKQVEQRKQWKARQPGSKNSH